MTQTSFGEISQKRDPLSSYINNITSYYERGRDTIRNDIRNARLFKTELTSIDIINTTPVELTSADIINGIIEINSSSTSNGEIQIPTGATLVDNLGLLEEKIGGSLSTGVGFMTYIRNRSTFDIKVNGANSSDFIGTTEITLDSTNSAAIIFTRIFRDPSDPYIVKASYTLSGPFAPW